MGKSPTVPLLKSILSSGMFENLPCAFSYHHSVALNTASVIFHFLVEAAFPVSACRSGQIRFVITHSVSCIQALQTSILLLVLLNLSAALVCPDGGTCEDRNTCCRNTAGGYSCCPLPHVSPPGVVLVTERCRGEKGKNSLINKGCLDSTG